MSKSFWVIETARQTYWDGRKIGREAFFADKIEDACKFHDAESAEIARCWLLEPDRAPLLRSVEHSFIER